MDGTTANVAELAASAGAHGAWLMIDEAHSLGVLGRDGRGLVAGDADLNNRVQVLVGTLGKAFGTHGGFVAGSDELVETLIQSARTYIYTTALPAAVAAATTGQPGDRTRRRVAARATARIDPYFPRRCRTDWSAARRIGYAYPACHTRH